MKQLVAIVNKNHEKATDCISATLASLVNMLYTSDQLNPSYPNPFLLTQDLLLVLSHHQTVLMNLSNMIARLIHTKEKRVRNIWKHELSRYMLSYTNGHILLNRSQV